MGAKNFFSEPKENSKIKTAIVSKYFGAWRRVMHGAERIAYIDLFAGPGRYKDGTKSTPLMVLEMAIADPELCRTLVTVFNDADRGAAGSLASEIGTLPGLDKLKYPPVVDTRVVNEEVEAYFEQRNLVPSLVFFDPFGYKGLSLRLINSVVKDWGCECVFFFNYSRVNMGLSNPIVREHMVALFGEQRTNELAEELEGLSAPDRELCVVEALSSALKEMGKSRYVLPCRFRNEQGTRTSHYLFFVSKHPLGYTIMKDIMAKESSSRDQGVPSFEYCVADSRFPALFELSRPLDELEAILLDEFAGQTLRMVDVFERHHVGHRYIKKNYKDALRNLEASGRITAGPPVAARKKNTFADKVLVTFPSKERG